MAGMRHSERTCVTLSSTAGCTLYCAAWPVAGRCTSATAVPLARWLAEPLSTSEATSLPAANADFPVDFLASAAVLPAVAVTCVLAAVAVASCDCTTSRPDAASRVTDSSVVAGPAASGSGAGIDTPSRAASGVWPCGSASVEAAEAAISNIAAPGSSAWPCTCRVVKEACERGGSGHVPDQCTCARPRCGVKGPQSCASDLCQQLADSRNWTAMSCL